MTIAVTIKTTKDNGATVHECDDTGKDYDIVTTVPKDSERTYHVYGTRSLHVREKSSLYDGSN